MTGRRILDFEDPICFEPGDYGFWKRGGHWVASTPTGDMANLGAHAVNEHKDGTITVRPSIAVSTSRGGKPVQVYHGFLERGMWRTA